MSQLFIIFIVVFFVIVLSPREGGYSLSLGQSLTGLKKNWIQGNSGKHEPDGLFQRATLRGIWQPESGDHAFNLTR